MATTSLAIDSILELSREREQIVRELAQVSDTECRYPVQWNGVPRNVNFLLRAFALNELDHVQDLGKVDAMYATNIRTAVEQGRSDTVAG